jgi:histidinol dehydrogenase
LIAGPSEIVVLADDTADVDIVAADMRAQGEHGADSTPICITTSPAFAASLRDALRGERGEIFGARDLDEAIAAADAIAPEHLELQLADAESVVSRIENCAAIFVGRASGVAFGDYVAGSNHVLPTAGSARFSSALGVTDFVKRRSIVRLSDRGAAALAPVAATIARAEGLPMHAASCEVRERVGSIR